MRDAARGLRRTPGMVFGLLALVVAIIGLYAILAFAVAQRRRELGIRSALGARGADLVWLVMRQAGAFVAAGLLIGTALAAAAGRFVEGLLFNVKTGDPLVYGAVVIVLGGARREPRPRLARHVGQSRVSASSGLVVERWSGAAALLAISITR